MAVFDAFSEALNFVQLQLVTPRVCRRLQLLRGWSHDEADQNKFSLEVRARAPLILLCLSGRASWDF
jgi:hypothetical protein